MSTPLYPSPELASFLNIVPGFPMPDRFAAERGRTDCYVPSIWVQALGEVVKYIERNGLNCDESGKKGRMFRVDEALKGIMGDVACEDLFLLPRRVNAHVSKRAPAPSISRAETRNPNVANPQIRESALTPSRSWTTAAAVSAVLAGVAVKRALKAHL